ncbi:hypothetical protein EDD99_4384 [Streptomyces sp. 846.5]|nr:hypothetical protein EDD99_4384 [Streptomyces sp. 846.5]
MHHHPTRDLTNAAPGPAPLGARSGAVPAPCLGRSFDSCTRPDP